MASAYAKPEAALTLRCVRRSAIARTSYSQSRPSFACFIVNFYISCRRLSGRQRGVASAGDEHRVSITAAFPLLAF